MKSHQTPIAVLSFNKPTLTERCIESIITSGYDEGCIHLIDNGSNIGVLEQHEKRFPGIKSHRTEKNAGFSGGFNFGLKSIFSLGFDRVLFLTNDTEIRPNVVESLVESSQKNNADIVAPCLTYRKYEDKIDSIGGYVDRERGMLGHYKEEGLDLILRENDYIPGTALLINNHAFAKLGGVDEEYFMYWEDVDLSFRAHQKRLVQARCYEAKIKHGIGQTCHKKPIYTTYYFQRNRIRFCKTHLTTTEWENVSQIISSELSELKDRWTKAEDHNRLQYINKLETELVS